MKKNARKALAALAFLLSLLTACSTGTPKTSGPRVQNSADLSGFLKFVDDDPNVVDPQLTSEYYTLALNVFDRLVEVRVDPESGESELAPSLAESWDISPDGLTYQFHLREGVTFSDGSPLTASDVNFTLTRLLTHPNSVNGDVASSILGAQALSDGSASSLAGFRQESDLDFSLTLEQPYAAFLACLSTPGASILSEKNVTQAGDSFCKDPKQTVGTGPFVFEEWTPGARMVLTANKNCWSGPPRCDGLYIQLVSDTEAQRLLFESGAIDILDLDNMSDEAEFFIHGDIYQDNLCRGPRVGIAYITFNSAIEPLDDARVRRALQISLDRQLVLDAVFGGRGAVENGIFPRGLIGFNPDLPEIPYDPAEAVRLLAEAGFPDGFDLPFQYGSNSTSSTKEVISLAVSMWREIGVRATAVEIPESDFLAMRKNGALTCYSSTWSADFNDPDNFIYTFFGTEANTFSRSLRYADAAVMERVRNARAIVDEAERIREYQDLERKIVQEDAAWIPLFSKEHIFVVSDRVDGFRVSWNGWSSNCYRDVAVRE